MTKKAPTKGKTASVLPRGYLYRRQKGEYLPITSEVSAPIWLDYRVGTRNVRVSMRTREVDTAINRAMEHLSAAPTSDETSWLVSQVSAGERAAARLQSLAGTAMYLPIADVWGRYERSKRRPVSKPATLRFYRGMWKQFEKWVTAGDKARSLTHVDAALAERYATALDDQALSSGTVNKHVAFFRLLWSVLMPDRPNVWKRLRSTKTTRERPYRRLSHEEACRVWARAGDLQDLMLLAYYTALRLVDAVHVRWSHIDWSRKALVGLTPQKTSRSAKEVAIPLMDELEVMLRRRFSGHTGDGWVFEELVAEYDRDSTILPGRVVAVFRACEVTDTSDGKASYSSWRKTFVTSMDEANVHPRVTDRVTAHAKKSDMPSRYSKVDLDVIRAEMQRALRPLTGHVDASATRPAGAQDKQREYAVSCDIRQAGQDATPARTERSDETQVGQPQRAEDHP
jgi:integrase